MHNPMKYIQF